GRAEDMRMPANHLVADCLRDVLEGELAALLSHARMEHNLEQEIAELVLEGRRVVELSRFGDLVGFLDRVGRDRPEVLCHIPRATRLRIAQPRHDRQKTLQLRGRGHEGHSVLRHYKYRKISVIGAKSSIPGA